MVQSSHNHDPLQPHAHNPNLTPPSSDPAFTLSLPDGISQTINLADLCKLPQITVHNCYIVSTGHGTSGPFTFGGVALHDLIQHYLSPTVAWRQAEVVSADKFGSRVHATELFSPDPAGPILLATTIDAQPMTRTQGLVRLIVPSETDDALRQVKWVAQITIS